MPFKAESGLNQEYEILQSGTANYLTTQEGPAIFRPNKVLPEFRDKLYWSMQGVLAIEKARYSVPAICAQLWRRSATARKRRSTKAVVPQARMRRYQTSRLFYQRCSLLRGLQMIRRRFADGNDLKRLYVGRVSMEDLETIEELADLEATDSAAEGRCETLALSRFK